MHTDDPGLQGRHALHEVLVEPWQCRSAISSIR